MNTTAIAIVAIVCWAIVKLVNGPRDKKFNKQDTQKNTELEQHVLRLQDRIETLEKIVTDDKYDLNRQFNDLKKDRVA
jgi:phage shock protein B